MDKHHYTDKQIDDELTVFWVIYEDRQDNVNFLKDYKDVLKERFRQEDIMMYSISVTRF